VFGLKMGEGGGGESWRKHLDSVGIEPAAVSPKLSAYDT
jgi:hypothetical protein